MLNFEHFVVTGCVSESTNGCVAELASSEVKVFWFIYKELKTNNRPVIKTMDEIADFCGMSRRSVSRAVSKLTDLGILLVHEQTSKQFWYYGVNKVTFTLPIIYNRSIDVEELVFDDDIGKVPCRKDAKSNANEHYVYICKLDDKPIYVGKGVKDRYKHAISGQSSNLKLNEAFFTYGKERMSVEILRGGLDNKTAIEVEASTIRALLASGVKLYNTTVPVAVPSQRW